MVSSGAVAFSVLSLLPVELILQVGGSAGFAMIFTLLIAAIVWNLWYRWLGLPGEFVTHLDRLDHRGRSHQPIHEHGGVRHLGKGRIILTPAGSSRVGRRRAPKVGRAWRH